MEASENRETIVLYSVPLLPELEVKSLIINLLPQANLTPQNIDLKKKDGKYQAFIMVPQEKSQQICALKSLKINNQVVFVRKSLTGAQIFIGRLPKKLSINEIKNLFETNFGKVLHINEGLPFELRQTKFWHCFVQFQNDADAEKCLFCPTKIMIGDFQLRPTRVFSPDQNDKTDKKLFLNITSEITDTNEAENTINDYFRKEGQLREKIKIDDRKATITFTSPEVADRVLMKFKGEKIGNYNVVLKPYTKDSYIVFIDGLRPDIKEEDLPKIFKNYKPIVSCTIKMNNHNPNYRNGTITFGSQQTYKKLLLEYIEDQSIRQAFVQAPYITPHMTTKDRQDYMKFMAFNSKNQNSKPQPTYNQPNIPPPPMGYIHSPMYAMPPPQMPYIPNHPMMGAPKYPANRPAKYAPMQ